MDCPYCLEPVKDGALMCPHCTSNLAVLTPLLARLTVLESRLATLEADLTARSVGIKEPAAAPALDGATRPAPENGSGAETAQAGRPRHGPFRRLVLDVMSALVLLVIAHAFLVFVLDWPVLVLRLLCVVIPMLCATRAALRQPAAFRWNLIAASLLGVSAVLGMSASVAVVDQVPLLPHGGREWRETLEFAFSIATAWQTGYLLGMRAARHRGTQEEIPGLLKALAIATSPPGTDYAQLERRANVIGSLTGSIVPVLTAGMSVLSGLRSLLQ